MVDALVAAGRARSPRVAAALRAVDRGRFVPPAEASSAYDDSPVRLHEDAGGALVSTISQPSMVAYMLEELDVQPGHRVLEVGTASGYNAALLAELAGPEGRVVSVELEPSLAAAAARRLADASVRTVTVVEHDGHDGYPPSAPYDRIIVTAGATRVEVAWCAQLVEGGRLVVPLTDDRGRGRCVTFDLVDGRLVRRSSLPCGFVALRRP
jgi:protein-L-isoaspartate(D-aspartate) O-methyltransferase